MHPAQAPLDKDALAKYQAQWTEAVKTFYTSPFAWYYTFPWWSMWCAPAFWLTNHQMPDGTPSQSRAESLSNGVLVQVDVAVHGLLHVALAVDVDVLVLSCQRRLSKSNGQVAENAFCFPAHVM